MEKAINRKKIKTSELIAEYKRLVKKYYHILEDHEKDEDYLKEYDDKLNDKKYNNLDDLKDDHYDLEAYFKSFILKYYLEESERNNKFHYALKNNEMDDEFHYNLKNNDYILEKTIDYHDKSTINNKQEKHDIENVKEKKAINDLKEEIRNDNREQQKTNDCLKDNKKTTTRNNQFFKTRNGQFKRRNRN